MQEEPQREHFNPEKIDEQIGRLQQEDHGASAEERLVRDLGRAYHEDAVEEQAIERIGQRLAIHAAQRSLSDKQTTPFTAFTSEFQGRKERNRMNMQAEKSVGSHVWVRRWGMLAATALAILIVGSLLVALQMARVNNGSKVSSVKPGNQYANAVSPSKSSGMYVGVNNQLARIDMQTRKVVWRFVVKSEPNRNLSLDTLYVKQSPLVVGQTVYFTDYNGRLYGLDTQTGKLRWERDFQEEVGQIVTANGLLYINTETPESVNNNTYGVVYALDPKNGTTKREFHVPGAIASISNGVLYLSNITTLTAINLTDGRQLWQTAVDATQVLNQSVVIKNGILYASSYRNNGAKTADEPQDSYVYTLDQQSGKITWASEMMNGLVFNVAVGDDGRVYCGAQNHYVYAFDPQSKTSNELWKYHTIVGHVYPAPIVQGGVVYVGQSSEGSNTGNNDHLVALDAATGAQKWSTPLVGYTGLGEFHPLALNNGVIYLSAGRGSKASVQGFAITNGKQVSSIPNNVLFSQKDAGSELYVHSIIITIVP